MPEKLMTTDDVADLFHVSKKTVYRWNQYGTGPIRIRIGSQIFYRPSDVETFITESQVGA